MSFNTRPGELFQVQVQNGVLPEDIWWTVLESDTYEDADEAAESRESNGFSARIVSNQRGIV